MRPARVAGWGGGFGGGSYATRLTFAIAAISVLVALVGRADGGNLLHHLLFRPASVMRGEVWQLLTYALVYPLHVQGIFGFLISLYFLYVIGGQVEAVLGSKRFLGFILAIPVLSALITIPFAYLLGFEGRAQPGLWVALGALTIVFAHHFAHQPIYLMFFLPVQGRALIWISFGILGLYAILGGIGSVFPALVGMLLALGWSRGWIEPRKAWLRFRARRIERQLRRRASRFAVIDGERKDEPLIRRSNGDRGPWLH